MNRKIVSIYNIVICISVIICIFSLINNSTSILVIDLGIVTITILCKTFQSLEKNIGLFFFEVFTILFLSGSVFMNFFVDKNTGLENLFSSKIIFHTIFCLYISQIALYLGYQIQDLLVKKKNITSSIISLEKMKLIETTSMLCLVITVIPKIVVEIERSRIINKIGYVESYLGYSSSIPGFIQRIAQGYNLFFWLFLCTKPSKKKTFFVLGINILIALISLRSGKRSSFILPLVMTIIYLFYRNKDEKDGKIWIKKRWILYGVILSPFIIAIAQQFTYIRLNLSADYSIVQNVRKAFEESSVNIISYGKVLDDIIPDNGYTFGMLWMALIRNQSIFGKLLGIEPLANQTVDMALQGNSFGQTITYLVNSNVYFRGGGLGSCYISEAYKDFGYIGIIFFSILIGMLLFKFSNSNSQNVYLLCFMFIMQSNLLLAPRDAVFGFICNTFTITNLLYIFIFWIFIELYSKRYKFRGDNR